MVPSPLKRGITSALALILATSPAVVAQGTIPGTAHIHWPLIDIVLVPDTCDGVWMLAAPNTATDDWSRGTGLTRITIDPVLLLQWAATARLLARAPASPTDTAGPGIRTTPRLESRARGAYVLLARSTRLTPAAQRLQFLVVDSVRKTQWKTFASIEQVEELLDAAETVAARASPIRAPTDSTLIGDDRTPGVEPASIVRVPAPHYPSRLRHANRQGRVWVEYIIGADGRPEAGSLHVLLADDPEFAVSAAEALTRATFKPARRHGTPVRQRVIQVIAFRLRS